MYDYVSRNQGKLPKIRVVVWKVSESSQEKHWEGGRSVVRLQIGTNNSIPSRIMSDVGYLYSVGYERKEGAFVKAERGEVREKRRA